MSKRNLNPVRSQQQSLKKPVNVKKAVFIAATIISLTGVTSTAHAWYANCWGVIRGTPGNDFISQTVGSGWGGIFAQSNANQNECNVRVTDWAGGKNRQDVANAACASGQPNNSTIRAWSSVGTSGWRSSHWFGILTNIPASTVRTYVCPAGSINLVASLSLPVTNPSTFNMGGVASMITLPYDTLPTQGHCMKLAVAYTLLPSIIPPARGTKIGGGNNTNGYDSNAPWGYAWDREAHQRVAPIAVDTVTPAQCHF
ncbi:hypothetical protein [Crenothrix polyspora]|uniref:Uncharacterized protein n=1 Tax=Crenothrix polyspora TaxID=360316 RepID=A0A1R4H4F9_9GAMM|nr:hypothetical protein [Crenothrix polyspora]SJM90710.1 hypothetical protein CRENPOLYSF1_1530002 [Crenothrix polyspora]